MPATFDFIEDAAPAATQFDFEPDPDEGPSIRERISEGFKTLPEPIKRISGAGGFQQPAIEVAPFWTTPPWVPAAKLLGFPKVAEAGQAMAEESANAISGLTTPVNVGLVAATKAYPPLGVAIAASMLPQIYEGGKQAYKGMTTGDIPEVVRGGTKAAIGTAGAVLGTLPLAARFLPRATAEAAATVPEVPESITIPEAYTGPTPPKIAAVEQAARRAAVKAARPVVPETPPEPQRGMTILDEIRAAGADTKAKIQKLFPQLSRETAAKLRDQAFPREKQPDNISRAEVDRLFLDKLNEESNREIEAATATPKPQPLTPAEQAEARADPAAELGEEPKAPVAPEPAPAPETPLAISAPEAKATGPSVADITSHVRDASKGTSIEDDTVRYALFFMTDKIEVDKPEIAAAMLGGKEIGENLIKAFSQEARTKGVPEIKVRQAEEQFRAYNEMNRIGTTAIFADPTEASKKVIVREGVLNTPAVEGARRERLDEKLYPAVESGEKSAATSALFPGGEERTAIPVNIRGKEPKVFLNVPITQSHLQLPRPADLNYPLVVTGNPHIANFRRPHPSWDANIKAVRVKPVYGGNEAVTRAAADAINYAKSIGARVLITTFRAKQPWTLARFTRFLPTDPSDPAFAEYWKPNPNPRPTDPRKMSDYVPYVPRNTKVQDAFRANGWGTERDIYGKGGTWWWPRSRELDPQILAKTGDVPLEYCDLLHKGCPSCRNCQKLTYPESAGSVIVGVTDEPFCEHGCPQCFVRLGQSGIKGRKGISIGENAKQAGFGQADLGDLYKNTINVLQSAARRGTRGVADYVSRFLAKPADDQMDTLMSLHMNGEITTRELVTAQNEIIDATRRVGGIGESPTELGMSIIPPQLKRSLKTFAIQDIAPALRAGVNTGKAAKDAIIHSLSPASAAEPRVVDTMFKSKGYSEQVMTQAASAMEEANKQVRVMPRADQIAFVDRVKRGQAQPTQELTDLADLMRRWDDYLYSEAQAYKPGLAYLDNHLRVLWKTIPGSTAKRGTSQQQVLSKRPWRGSQGFTKRHVLDDMSEGIALGGEPVTYNPVEMFLLHAQDVMKFVAANRAWQSLKGTGDVTFVKFGRKPPDDFVRINDSIAKAYFTPPGMKGVRAQTGEWWVQKDAARLIENYLSKDRIRNNPVGRALMGLKNATTAIELGLSPFHAVFESLETMGSTFGLGLSKIASGDIVSGLKTVAETPISPKTVSKLGRAGIKYAKNAAEFQATEPEAYNWFVNKFPGAAQLIDDMFAGGGQIGMHQDYKFRAGTGFGQALQEGNYPGAVLRAVPALNQAVMKPLFQIYIPRLKVGTFLREYSFELARRADDIAAGKITREQIARQTWAFVEDRFGEMNFDNLYWDRTFKSALQLLFRSVTWKLGNLRGFGKAARDATAELGWRWFTQGRAPEMTLPMAWALGMSVTTAVVSSLVTKAATGKYPWELAEHAGELVKNLVFPRISLTDESQRVSTPTYWRDAVHLSHSVPSYVSSSMSGEKGRIMDVWNNRDFYGVQVYNPDDPIPKKVAQAMQHLIPVPFGASSWLAAERTGATRGQALAGFFGFTKAPYYISHTAAEQKGLELVRSRMPQGSRTRDEFERSIRERQAVEAIKRGDMTVQEAFRDGLVTQDRMKQVQRRSTEPLLENLVTRLSPEDSLRVYKAAEPEEKDRLKFRLQQKILRSKKTPAEKGQLLVELEK